MITPEIKQELTENGVNYAALVKRFMNMDKMAEKFLLKFLTDKSMTMYKEAVEANDAQALFTATHTLKGVCGNLCVDCILDIITPAVEEYRAGSTAGAADVYEKVKAEYDKVCAIIKKI
ncbi:MAG: Hpt domain-containing protein [bacterium]|nr:Hpt domain-containing protein [bacterium]